MSSAAFAAREDRARGFVGREEGSKRRPAGQKWRVLLLEDSPSFARAVQWALGTCAEVTNVCTVREAIERLDEEWHAFVFDIGLPDGCGLEALRRARAARPAAAALAISAWLRPADINAAFEIGAHYLAKPFSADAVLAFFEQHLPPPVDGGHTTCDPHEAMVAKRRDQLDQLVAAARTAGEKVVSAELESSRCLALLARAVAAAEGDVVSNLEAVALAVGVSRQTLQDYVTLTIRWDPVRVATLIGATDRFGKVITKANLLRIARGPSTVRALFDEQVERARLDLTEVLAALR